MEVDILMKLRSLKDEDQGIVGIVVAFLITGLIVIVISIVQTVYVPKWMEQSEADHMEIVADQFSQLKFAIDTQSAIQKPDTPISTSITLGNKEIPFLMSSRAYGSLEILSDECSVIITNATDVFTCPLGIIRYSSVNTYYLNQEYVYEAGAIILSQSAGDIISIKPAFSAIKEEDVAISFSVVNISTIGDKRTINGYGTYPIQTEYPKFDPSDSVKMVNVNNLTIRTNHKNAWSKFINKTLINAGLEYSKNFSIDLSDKGISVFFLEPTNITLNVLKINAQIAPGWIENVKGNY
jgi:hypothetical protein